MAQSLTLVLSDDLYQYLYEIAALTRQPLGELIAQSVKGNLPPRLADAPAEMHPELLAMQQMTESELRQIAVSQISPEQEERHCDLLAKNSEGEITSPERVELAFRVDGDQLELQFEPLDFVQVNAGMNQRMIVRALELLDPQPADEVLDLFCGLGNFTLPIARRVARVTGVEGEAGLVARAEANARRNGLDNASFHAADLTLDNSATPWARARYGKLLLDPPRSGAAGVLAHLPRRGTDRIVYVSCHPGSLARDAGILVERHGFELARAGVMDMFPQTAHVESIALFMR